MHPPAFIDVKLYLIPHIRSPPSQMMGKADGDNYTLDDMFVSSAAQREGEGRDEERMRSQAVAESRRLAASMDQCPRCFNSQELQKHLIVAIGAKVLPLLSSVPHGLTGWAVRIETGINVKLRIFQN